MEICLRVHFDDANIDGKQEKLDKILDDEF